jgi:DNA-binding transcriptional ArsR family regulator
MASCDEAASRCRVVAVRHAARRPMTMRAVRQLPLAGTALASLTVAPHPWWDILNSVVLLARFQSLPEFPYRTWARSALAALAGTPAADLLHWCTAWPARRVPAFLVPPDAGEAGLRDTDPGELRGRLAAEFPGEVPAPFAPFVTDPERALAHLNTRMDAYFELALQQWWPAVTAAVNEDIAFRGQAMAAGGIGRTLTGLHPRIHWSAPMLSISTTEPLRTDRCVGLVLVPLMFAQDRVLFQTEDDGMVRLGYQSRGTAALLQGSPRDQEPRDGRLAVLLGRTRAAVLQELRVPCTTTALAGRLNLAPSTVSEHLGFLVTLRVAARRRNRNRVYYALTPAGRQLLSVFGEEDAA